MQPLPGNYRPVTSQVWRSSQGTLGSSNYRYSFKINGDVFLRRPLLKWLVSAVKSLPTADLQMVGVDGDTLPAAWRIADSLPSLTHLSIAGRSFSAFPHVRLEASKIMELLRKPSPLVSLSLGPNLSMDRRKEPAVGAIPQLQHLEVLAAPAEFIIFLMQPSHSTFPALQDVTVITETCFGELEDLTNLSFIVD